jgi:hypothetical protein
MSLRLRWNALIFRLRVRNSAYRAPVGMDDQLADRRGMRECCAGFGSLTLLCFIGSILLPRGLFLFIIPICGILTKKYGKDFSADGRSARRTRPRTGTATDCAAGRKI